MASLAVYASTYGVRLFATFASLLTSVILSRGLGPAGRGDVTAFIAGVSLLVQFCGLGLSSSSVIELGERPERARHVGGMLLGGAVVVLPVAVVCALLLERFAVAGSPLLRGVAIAWPLAQLLGLNVQAAFLGLADYRWFNGMELASRGLSLLAVAFLFVTPYHEPAHVLGALFVAESVVVVVGVSAFLRRVGGCQWPETDLARRMVATGFRAYLAMLPAYVLVRSDVLMVHAWRGAAETGIYGVAAQVVTLMWMLPQVAGQVLFSHMTRASDRAQATARVAGATFWLLVACCGAAALLGYPAIRYVFGAAFVDAYPLLLLLLPGALALGVETTVVQYFNARGFPPSILAYWALAVAANLALNVYGIPRYGAAAAAVSSSVGYVLMNVLVVRRFRQETGIGLAELFRFPRGLTVAARPA